MNIFIVIIIANLFFCATQITAGEPAFFRARAYYISPAGNDNNAGTMQSPWKTILPVNSLHLNPGDSILFEGGNAFTGTLRISSAGGGYTMKRGYTGKGGNTMHTLLLGSYGKGPATILAGDSSAIILYLTNNASIKNLRLAGAGRKDGNSKDGLSLINCHQVSIDSLDITGFQKSGLLVYSSADIGVSHVYAHENGAAGITVEGAEGKKESRNIRIMHCLAENNPGDPINLTNHSGNGIVVGHCTSLLIDYCTATNNGWDMPRIGNGPVGIWCYEADSVVIQHCLSFGNKTSVGGADGGGFDLDGGVTNSVIQYCLSYGNQGSGYCIFQYWGASPWYNNVIRYNISENDGTVSDSRAGLYVWNTSGDAQQFHDCVVYNNTIYNSKEAAISFSETSERINFRFYNNIFVAKDSLIRGEKGVDVFLGNDWWSIEKKFYADGMTDFTDWVKKSGKEMISGKVAGFNIPPGFKDPGSTNLVSAGQLKSFQQYRIPSNSPLRKSGLDLHDLFGIHTGGLDFNQQPAPVKGVGASF